MSTTDYYLGLDMGTSSVGWAVTDQEYKLLRAKGKDLWGIREFEEAQTSIERRTHRISRRRRQRQQVRIGLVKSYFADAIQRVDPNFYLRLENSKYFLEDKDEKVREKNGIFADKDFTDKDYYEKYPTIFHLRKALLENQRDAFDVRLVYLAILNMFKHRGHFLNAGISDEGNGIAISDAYQEFVEMTNELFGIIFPEGMGDEIERILSDRNLSRRAKSEKLIKEFGLDQKMPGENRDIQKLQVSMLKCICGLSVSVKDIFTDIELEEKKEICFANASWEEKGQEVLEVIGEDNYALVESMKQIYDIGSLANILKGELYLSDARVEEYQKHHDDLKTLKQLYIKYKTKEEFDRMFRSEEEGYYSAYVNSYNSENVSKKAKRNGKPVRRNMKKKRTREELYNRIKADFKDINDPQVDYVKAEIERETFLPKQLTAGNGIIPNQVQKRELSVILKNAEVYLPFLSEKDESGLTVSERILRLFSFQIPYYIGPISAKSAESGGNGWVVRLEPGEVFPWNFEQKIDVKATAQKFIEKLVRSCTYLSEERVLPKAALLYEKYCVLNEINNIRISGEKISVALKQGIYKDLFCRKNKVTRKMITSYLVGNGVLEEESQLSGIDQNINNSLSSYRKFYSIFGEDLDRDDIKEMTEKIIYLCTVYGDARSMLKRSLSDEFGDRLSSDQIKKICGFRFKDWGSLSKEMLELRGCDKSTGEMISLIQAMWDTNCNFMELLHSDDFTFQESLKEKQTTAMKTLSDFQAEDLDELYFSAPVKRMIWQTILVIREIEKVMGCPPKRVFIEMTRTDEEKGDKGRKASREKELLELYKNIKDESRDWKTEITKANEDGSIRSKKLYLYYLQRGHCMYTDEPIDLHELMYGNQYDIDHIYPRHFVKDDNIRNNLVLVKKSSNAYKSDNYPLPAMRPQVYELWSTLLEQHMITEEKYRRLTGKNPFTEEQKAGFIARQMVETGQGTKGVADLLKQLLADRTTIVYSKGRNVSDFRKEYNLLKTRSLNDFHHAKDAYLNIVVGNAYYVKFTQDPLNYMRKLEKEKKTLEYHLGKMFDRDISRGDEVAWIAAKKDKQDQGTIVTVKKVMEKNTPLLTRMNFESHGKLTKETLYSAKEAMPDNYIPLKMKNVKMQDVTKYGGFTSVYGAYFFLVEHDEKGKKVRTLEQLPIYLRDEAEQHDEVILDYCIKKLGLKNPSIRLKKIKTQSLFEINGYRYHLRSKNGKQLVLRNAVSMCLNLEWSNYIHDIDKYIETGVLSESIKIEKNLELYEILLKKHLEGVFSKRLNPLGDKLLCGREKMKVLELDKQLVLLAEIIKLSQIGVATADLSLIGGSPTSGKLQYGKVNNANEFKLINQSVTGIYENTIDLLTV